MKILMGLAALIWIGLGVFMFVNLSVTDPGQCPKGSWMDRVYWMQNHPILHECKK